jgi:myo-inositol-1(or 4)-monophosphatase
MELKSYFAFGEKIILESGKILLHYKHKFKIKKYKGEFFNLATTADYSVEKFLIKKIKEQYPDHNIYSEETTIPQSNSPYQWVIDPLDGTKEYMRNSPYYCINLALEFKGKVIMGLVYQPEMNRLFSAVKKYGFELNSKKYKVSDQSILKNSIINIHLIDYRFPKGKISNFFTIFQLLTKKTLRVKGATWSIDGLCSVAMGSLEAFILPETKNWPSTFWWDIAPAIIMISEAGGKITDFFGNQIKNHDLTNGLVASNGKIHNELLRLLKTYYL